jgi:hypothetical protein
LGCFSDNPTRYHKEFLCLTWALTWGDIYNVNNTFTEDEKERYGRQQNSILTNSMNSIPIDIPLPLRQYLRLSLNGAIKMGTQDQIPKIIQLPDYWQVWSKIAINKSTTIRSNKSHKIQLKTLLSFLITS